MTDSPTEEHVVFYSVWMDAFHQLIRDGKTITLRGHKNARNMKQT